MQFSSKLKQGIVFIIIAVLYAVISDFYEQFKNFLGGQLSKLSLTPADLLFLIIGLVGGALVVVDILGKRRAKMDMRFEKKKEELTCATNLVEQIQAFINESPQTRLFAGVRIDDQWLREKALNLNQLVVTAKGLIGVELNTDDFRVNPDLLLQMNAPWGHLQSLASKLQGEVEVYMHRIKNKEAEETSSKEVIKTFAEETQRLRQKEDANQKHANLIYAEIDEQLSRYSYWCESNLGDWLSCPNPDTFTKELSSHLEAYNASDIARNAKQLCDKFNADLEKAINDTMKKFSELVEKLAEKEHAEGKKFSLQRYDIIPHPDRYYSPDILAWNIYHDAGAFQPYKIEPIQGRNGWCRIGNTVAQTDDRAELESFTELANDYSLKKVELFKKFYDRKKDALNRMHEFFAALLEIKKKLDSGHHLEGKCDLCPNADDVENGLAELRRSVKNKVDETCVND